MANMSYCRFENTLRDLRDCLNHMEDPAYGDGAEVEDEDDEKDELSISETKARQQLVALCARITQLYEEAL